jgi:tRNA-intron endonuclease
MQQVSAVYNGEKIVIPAQNEADSLNQDGYGSRIKTDVLTLDPCEALYLIEKERIVVINEEDGKMLSMQELLDRELLKDNLLWTKYIVYRDIRGRGFVIKDSKENNLGFVVYERGSYLKKFPSYHVYTVSEGITETIGHLEEVLNNITKWNRFLKLAVVDRRGEVIYYSLGKLDFDNLIAEMIE